MSGGVDSAVAAALLKEQGYDLVGVTMILACTTTTSERSCCSQAAARDAARVAALLGIPHYTLNYKEDFKCLIIDDFVAEYARGRTPNPCVRCNQFLKFDLLLNKARALGCERIATGHYARIVAGHEASVSGLKLLKGVDPKKDQSYFLYRLTQEQLAHTLFPLGGWSKDKVRKKAQTLGLPVAEKKESQEICFIPGDDYAAFIRQNHPELVRPGEIVDTSGQVVGRHEGVAFYTIGQRKGIGAHQGLPKYVVALDPVSNRVVIGDQEDLLAKELIATDFSFVSGETPAAPLSLAAQIRYNAQAVPAVFYPKESKVIFDQPQRAVTPGQSVVFYLPAGRHGQEEEVLGGGIIT